MRHVRQGDVLLKHIRTLPKGLTPKADGVVALGEATGHAHRVVGDAVIFADPVSQRVWVQVMTAATLQHEEHHVITLERGVYEVVGQREYTPEAIRRVTD